MPELPMIHHGNNAECPLVQKGLFDRCPGHYAKADPPAPESAPEIARSALQMLVNAETELEDAANIVQWASAMDTHIAAALEQVRAAQLRLTPLSQGAA